MPPSARVWGACRALAVRSRPLLAARHEAFAYTASRSGQRGYAGDSGSDIIKPGTSNQRRASQLTDAAGQVSPEALGSAGLLSNDYTNPEAVDDATLEQLMYGGPVPTSGGPDALTPAQEEMLYREGAIPPASEADAMVAASETSGPTPTPMAQSQAMAAAPGSHKFPLPERPYPQGFNLRSRYHPVLDQIVRLLMRDGKLGVAQRNMAVVMNVLRTAPAPIYSPKFPLLPGTPPASHLPLNPVLYMTVAIDSVAPLIKVTYVKGAAGGGRALELPMPLKVRQRRRLAFKWILDVVNKKPSKGSGRKQLPVRIAEEIIAVVEGRSSVWDKRSLAHKLGTAARANVNSSRLKVKGKKG